MKQLFEPQLLKLIDTESIYVINIENGNVTLLADLEYWQDDARQHAYNSENDPYRIETFGWELDKDLLDNICVKDAETGEVITFYTAVDDARGTHCGGINFYHENNDERKKFPSAVAQLWDMYRLHEPVIFDLTDKEFSDIYPCLKDGTYILVF